MFLLIFTFFLFSFLEVVGDAGEVFIPARNKKEVEDIYNLNNAQAKAKIKSLKSDLKKHGSVNESDLSSTRRELQMKSNQICTAK